VYGLLTLPLVVVAIAVAVLLPSTLDSLLHAINILMAMLATALPLVTFVLPPVILITIINTLVPVYAVTSSSCTHPRALLVLHDRGFFWPRQPASLGKIPPAAVTQILVLWLRCWYIRCSDTGTDTILVQILVLRYWYRF
jgi:hypothetical protein